MANFIIRVELIDIVGDSFELYNRLHEAITVAGFKKSIGLTGHDFRYELPDAEYFIRSSSPIVNVRDLAKSTVESVWRKFRLLVVEAENISGYNLRQVSE